MMTPERRAALKDRWSGGAYEELFAEIDNLRAALRETQQRADDNFTSYECVKANASALQRRVEALEGGLKAILYVVPPDGLNTIRKWAEAALGSEEKENE